MKLKDELMQLRVDAFDSNQRMASHRQKVVSAEARSTELSRELKVLKRDYDE